MLYKAGVTEECSFYKMGVYKCDVCAKVFTEEKNLLRQQKSTHGEKNSYKCDLCNKVYGRAEHLLHRVSLPVLYRVRRAKLLTQHVVRGDFWILTNGSPPC